MKWETFFDEAYFHMWAVRPVGDKDFYSDKLFHLVHKNEAEELVKFLDSITKGEDDVGEL